MCVDNNNNNCTHIKVLVHTVADLIAHIHVHTFSHWNLK